MPGNGKRCHRRGDGVRAAVGRFAYRTDDRLEGPADVGARGGADDRPRIDLVVPRARRSPRRSSRARAPPRRRPRTPAGSAPRGSRAHAGRHRHPAVLLHASGQRPRERWDAVSGAFRNSAGESSRRPRTVVTRADRRRGPGVGDAFRTSARDARNARRDSGRRDSGIRPFCTSTLKCHSTERGFE